MVFFPIFIKQVTVNQITTNTLRMLGSSCGLDKTPGSALACEAILAKCFVFNKIIANGVTEAQMQTVTSADALWAQKPEP